MVLTMDKWYQKVAIVTGASAGIGAAITQKLAHEGIIVVGLDRRYEQVKEISKKLIKEMAKGKLYAYRADVSQEEDILKAFKWVKENLGPIHILINNAGVIQITNLVEGCTEKWKKVFDTNVIGLCVATREAVKNMRENDIDGHIIHINSVAGHKVPNYPNINVYAASKYAVTALTETLRQELNSYGTRIKVTSISPGAVETEVIQSRNGGIDEKIMEALKSMPLLKTEDVADAVMYVLSTPKHVQVHELIIKPLNEQF